MLSKPQIFFIKGAQRQVGLNDQQWRTLLQNVADVSSSKDLNNTSFEDVMAVLEDEGFRDTKRPGDFWRNKVKHRGRYGNERMVRKIIALAEMGRYCLPAMCERISKGRTQLPDRLTPKECWNLIEALKQINAREAKRIEAGERDRLTDAEIGELVEQATRRHHYNPQPRTNEVTDGQLSLPI